MRSETLLELEVIGRVTGARGPLIRAVLPTGSVGDLCVIELRRGNRLRAQVVECREEQYSLAPFGPIDGIAPGDLVRSFCRPPEVSVGIPMLGSCVNYLGEPLGDDEFPQAAMAARPLESSPPPPLSRTPIQDRMWTGINSIDAITPLAFGQRLALIAPAGAGKSTLLGELAQRSNVDVVVVALVGERGREVRDFVESAFDPESRRRSVIVIATSDEAPVRRRLAPLTATTIAEFFRDRGLRVLLLIDSLTRVARAIRDVGIAAGEIPIRQGYTPSVYAELPRLIERSGSNAYGSITAIYTLLSNGEGDLDPLSEEVKSLLDGHIVLAHSVAQRGIRPALNPLESLSRVCGNLLSDAEEDLRRRVIHAFTRLTQDKRLLLLGGAPDDELAFLMSREQELFRFLNGRSVNPREAVWTELRRILD